MEKFFPKLRPSSTQYVLFMLFCVAFAVRVIGAKESILYIPDTQVIRQGLDIGQQIVADRSYDVNLGGELKYPLTLSAVGLVVYGGVFCTGLLTGDFSSVTDFENYIFSHRADMLMLAVFAFAVIGALIVPAIFVAARNLNRRHLGWLAVSLAIFNVTLVHFGHHPRPHIPLATLSLIAIIFLVSTAQGGRTNHAYAATIFSALTLGTLQNGFVIIVPFLLVWVVRAYDATQRKIRWRELFSRLTLSNVGLFALLSVVLYPPLVTEYPTLIIDILTGTSNYSLGAGQHTFSRNMFALANIEGFVKRIYNYQPILTVLVPLSAPYTVWRLRTCPRLLIVALPFPLINLLAWALYANSFPRINAVLIPYFILVDAYFLEDVIHWIAKSLPGKQRIVYAAIGFGIVLPSLITALRLVYVTSHTDTRSLATSWVEDHIPGETAIITNFSAYELQPTVASLERKANSGEALGTYEQWLIDLPPGERPSGPQYNIFEGKKLWSGDVSAIGQLIIENDIGYALVSSDSAVQTGDFSLTSALLSFGTLVEVICPGDGIDYVYLPSDLGFPAWRAVWEVNRAGPVVMIVELDQNLSSETVGAGTFEEKIHVCQ